MIFSDKQLSARLELTEARAKASYIATKKRLLPEEDADLLKVGGTYAMFDGPESPLTQT